MESPRIHLSTLSVACAIQLFLVFSLIAQGDAPLLIDDIDPGEVTSPAPSAPSENAPIIAVPVSPEEQALRSQIESIFPADRHYRQLGVNVIAETYLQRGMRPLWDASALALGFHRNLGAALKKHAMSELLALDPESLVSQAIEGPVDARDLAHTVAFCDAALLVRIGAVPPTKIWPDWNVGNQPGSDDQSVTSIVGDLVTATVGSQFDMETAIDTMAPKNWIYRELLKAYPGAREAILKYSGLPQIPNPEQVGAGRPGDVYPAAAAIAAHLIDRGYLKIDPSQAGLISSMTPELTTALIAFQNDYGLDPDGIFGQASWRYLNANAVDLFRTLTLNLHRARILPGKLGARYLIANLPDAELHLFDANDFHAKSMRIIYGKADKESHRTRIFRDRMREVVFGPYWNVPPSIATKELLPRIQEDWSYLSRNDYEIVSAYGGSSVTPVSTEALSAVAQGRLFLRQKPGQNNALGYVKFLFPNSFSIYMHDTPSRNLFARANRDFSHGCIRVAKPDELAEWIFAPEGWTLDRVKHSMTNELNKGMAVKNEVNVYITYFTLFPRPSASGRILLSPGNDSYGLDPVDARTLSAVLPWQEGSSTAFTSPSGGQ